MLVKRREVLLVQCDTVTPFLEPLGTLLKRLTNKTGAVLWGDGCFGAISQLIIVTVLCCIIVMVSRNPKVLSTLEGTFSGSCKTLIDVI